MGAVQNLGKWMAKNTVKRLSCKAAKLQVAKCLGAGNHFEHEASAALAVRIGALYTPQGQRMEVKPARPQKPWNNTLPIHVHG